MLKPKKCLICGDIFIPTSGRQRYCKKPIPKICVVCGQEFMSECAENVNKTCDNPECKREAKYAHTNITLDVRKCKRCGQEFKPKTAKQQYCNKKEIKTCPICGVEFEVTCSAYVTETCGKNECQGLLAKKIREENLKDEIRICKWCGLEFTPKENLDKYCYRKHYKECKICGKQFEVDVRTSIYSLPETCSDECKRKLMSINHDYVKGAETYKRVLKERYGVESVMEIEGVKDKIKATNLEKYGAEWYTQTDEYRDKIKETNLQKYGVEHHLQSKEVIEKRIETVKEKYGTENVFQSEAVKEKIKQTNLEKYGAQYVSQVPEIKSKATKSARNSSLEERICKLLDDYCIEYVHHYYIKNENGGHEFDFYIPQFHLLIDADGLYFHAYLDDPDGVRVREDYDALRLNVVPEDCRFAVLVEGSEEQQLSQLVKTLEECSGSLSKFDSVTFEWCRSIDFPYPSYTEKRMNSDWKHLKAYHNDQYVPQCRIGQSILKNFHRSIYHARVGNSLSPYEGWNDDTKLRQVIRNRHIYINNIDPSKVLAGFNISKICPCVSTFNPILARYLTLKYLSNYSTVFDPFSGFSGRLLGIASTDKKYIGQDLNGIAVSEANKIIDFLQLDRNDYSVTTKDVLKSQGEYECLLTCPPYSTKEIYNAETTFKTCDGWIEECLRRFKCERYVFVVDETSKYSEYVVEELTSASHFGTVSEKVIVI